MTDIYVAPKQGINKKTKNMTHPHHMNILSAFSLNPQDVSFQNQKDNESIILFLRPHIITNIPWIISTALLLVLPLIIAFILPALKLEFLSSPIINHFATVYILLYYLIVFSYMFVSFLTWFYNIFIVTPGRIVDIDYCDIVVHNVSETKLNQIEDVRYDQSGFIPTLFNYGNLFAQTAGTRDNFEAISIPKPKEATNIIASLIGGKE
jgi:hypothetical protein